MSQSFSTKPSSLGERVAAARGETFTKDRSGITLGKLTDAKAAVDAMNAEALAEEARWILAHA